MVDELRARFLAGLLGSLFLLNAFQSSAAETNKLETSEVEAGGVETLPEDPGSDVPELAAGAKADDEELPSEGESAGQADGTDDYSNLVSYDCGKGRVMQIHYIAQGVEEYALVIADGKTRGKLDIVPSGSGVRYANQDLEWHTKANQGLLIRKDQVLNCTEMAVEPNQPSQTEQMGKTERDQK